MAGVGGGVAGGGAATTEDLGGTMVMGVEVVRGEEGIRVAEAVEEDAMATVRSGPVGKATEEHTEVGELAEARTDSGEVEVGVVQVAAGMEEESTESVVAWRAVSVMEGVETRVVATEGWTAEVPMGMVGETTGRVVDVGLVEEETASDAEGGTTV